MSYFERHIAPLSLNPSCCAPLLARATYRSKSLRIGLEMACQPVQASSCVLGSRLSGRMLLRSSRSLQLSGPAGQYLPLPYMPSMPETKRVSSSLSLGSEGVAIVSDSLRSLSLRAVTGSSLSPSNLVDTLA